jgi:SMC interacting uncharacterized protein involved in chromosome segregation
LEIKNLKKQQRQLQKDIAVQLRKMEKAPTGEKTQYRPLLIKLKKSLRVVDSDLEAVRTEARDVRSQIEKVAPKEIKQLKAKIRMVLIHH